MPPGSAVTRASTGRSCLPLRDGRPPPAVYSLAPPSFDPPRALRHFLPHVHLRRLSGNESLRAKGAHAPGRGPASKARGGEGRGEGKGAKTAGAGRGRGERVVGTQPSASLLLVGVQFPTPQPQALSLTLTDHQDLQCKVKWH